MTMTVERILQAVCENLPSISQVSFAENFMSFGVVVMYKVLPELDFYCCLFICHLQSTSEPLPSLLCDRCITIA